MCTKAPVWTRPGDFAVAYTLDTLAVSIFSFFVLVSNGVTA